MSKEIWTLDAETDPFDGSTVVKPFIWGAYNGDDYEIFINTADMIDFFIDKDVIVYAHNGGKFDYYFMLEYFADFTPIMVIAGRMSKFKIGLAEFRDSINILPFSLDTYKKDDIDYSIFTAGERDKPENMRKIKHYLKTDCVYLHEIVTAFIDLYGLHLTQAGAAMKIWAKMAGIRPPKTSKDFYDRIAPYYYGGRVEAFRIGEINEHFKVIDINSAYPYAMTFNHAYGSDYSISKSLPATQAEIQRAFISLSAESTGAFPFRAENGGLSFPSDGKVRTFDITGWEFISAHKTGTLGQHEILKVISFTDKIEFSGYVAHFSDLKISSKKSGDKAGYLFAKIFLNALYGKFGSNPDKYKTYELIPQQYITASESEGKTFCGNLGHLSLMQEDLADDEQRFYNVAVSASITGFVRAYMWDAMTECENVMYCDTDSIICTGTGDLDLHPTELGAWDIEAMGDYGGIAGKKLYALQTDNGDWKTASKGVRLDAHEILAVAKGKEIVFHPMNPQFSLKRGVRFQARKVKRSILA